MKFIGKGIMIMALSLFCVIFISACGKKSDSLGDKVREVEYTIAEIEDVPEILVEEVIQGKNEAFQLSLVDGDYLYIAVGYGKQDTYGYSISVKDVYLTDEYLVVETNLIGPEPNEKVVPEPDYPFIVLKTENADMPICYK